MAIFFVFLKEEDGIRFLTVTGVQTCALPISRLNRRSRAIFQGSARPNEDTAMRDSRMAAPAAKGTRHTAGTTATEDRGSRSEERRGGEECRSRWSPYH